jgi:histidinol dehydrogenase
MSGLLPRRRLADLLERRTGSLPSEALEQARAIVEHVRVDGEHAVREHAARFGERQAEEPLYLTGEDLRRHLRELPAEARARLERIAARIRDFAHAQLETLGTFDVAVDGGRAGHRVDPVHAAGCYAPGGRYPLPSSVLMTAVTARAAGVESVWVASPRPAPITLAAAALAGVDGLLAVGGAHAIAGLAYGVGPVPASDVIVGPGNLYVTAAKQIVAGQVRIDMLAGPSELVILCDDSGKPEWIAADLLAQAEHDTEAVPVLITTDASMIEAVEEQLRRQLQDLPTAATAIAALANGGAVVCETLAAAVTAINALAPEHLQLCLQDAEELLPELHNYGAVFCGHGTAEVFGDYGLGPNHVLPTGGTARARGGLSVLDFLRVRTWLRVDPDQGAAEWLDDVVWLARQEGLEAHARAAELRRTRRANSRLPELGRVRADS